MSSFRFRPARCAAVLVLLTALVAGDALAARSAAEAERIAMFAQRYKQLQQHLLLEGAERREELAGERLGPAPDSTELAGPLWSFEPARTSGLALPSGPAPLSANVRANNPTLDAASATQSEVSLAASGDKLLVAFNDGQGLFSSPRSHTQGYAWSANGGQSFTDGGAPPTLAGWLWDSDPLTAVNENTGEFWYAGLNSNNAAARNGIAVAKATISGAGISWGTPRMVRWTNDNEVILDKEWMAVDPASGRLYVVYTAFGVATPTDTIEIQSSSDGGLTWSNPLALSDPADDGYVQGARVAVGPAVGGLGEVYVTWYRIGRTAPYQDSYPVRKSTNGGASFTPATSAAYVFANFSSGAPGFNRPRGIDFPTLTVDHSNGPRRGRVYVGWQECVDFYNDNLGTLARVNETEPNDAFTQAATFVVGDSLLGTLTPGDIDFYKFNALQGQTVECFGQHQAAGLDFSMRLLCADGNTMLAVAAAGPDQDNLVVFTIPANGTYYLRVKGLSASGAYTVFTGFHTPQPDDRARDHRDIFVASSDDGVVWSVPARVNSDPPWLDNWLPEFAVSNLSKVYASWYDWRDAPAAVCNAQSQVYLASSDDGGATWSTLGALSDAASDWTDWTNAKSNLQPNQGDYNVLFADCQAVYGGWSDARDADVNVYTARYPPLSQPTLVTFANAIALPHQVSLAWQAQGGAALTGDVQRRLPGGVWATLTPPVVADVSGRMPYLDASVSPGTSYEYQLIITQPPASAGWVTCSVAVDVPLEVQHLVLGPARPNPTQTDIIVSFSLPTNAPATLQILDLSGRKLYAREVGSLGPGSLTLNLGTNVNLRSGIYFLRLAQSGQEATSRISVIR